MSSGWLVFLLLLPVVSVVEHRHDPRHHVHQHYDRRNARTQQQRTLRAVTTSKPSPVRPPEFKGPQPYRIIKDNFLSSTKMTCR